MRSGWLDRQRDREANGENYTRWFGTDRNEFGHSLLTSEWSFGLDVGAVDRHRWFGLNLGPLWIGYCRWIPR